MAQEITNNRGKRKERKGIVISRMGNKSIRVLTETRKPHPVYGKVLTYKSRQSWWLPTTVEQREPCVLGFLDISATLPTSGI